MGRKFELAEDIVKRLHSTICLYKGKPVYVQYNGTASTTHVKICPVEQYNRIAPSGKIPWEEIDYTQDIFRYKAFPLGYMNHLGNAYYLSRIPYRYQWYGLNPDCINWEPASVDPYYGNSTALFSEGFVKMIAREYPSLDDVEGLLYAGHKSVAISPDVAIQKVKGRTVHLMFKGKNVGIKMGSSVFTLYDIPEAKFLRKILTAQGVNT